MGRRTKNDVILKVENLSIYYGKIQAIKNVSLDVRRKQVTSIIGPSGCGKSTLLRAFNRMNDFNPVVRTEGNILYCGKKLYGKHIDPTDMRRNIGMVFQKPNPFPKSIFNNITWGPKINGFLKDSHKLVEQSLKRAALWDEVKDRLQDSALDLSGGQQQRLCIARAIAMNPAIILMDEPCSALDPKGTAAVEELIWELRGKYSILMVTHNMAQARRSSEECIFMLMGKVIEHSATADMFVTPSHQETADYIEGRYG